MTKLYNKKQSLVAVDSEDVVASGLDFGLYTLKYDPDLETNLVPESALRTGTELGSGAERVTVADTKRTKTGLDLQLEPVNLQARPTADFITHTTYKSDSKLVIRIVKSPASGANKSNDSEHEQTAADQNLYFDKFSLQSVAEGDDERYQLHETFESATLFMFGRRPRIWTYQGIVLNGKRPPIPAFLNGEANKSARESYLLRYNMDFANELLRRYEKYYRGTATVDMNARAYVLYDDTVVEGTMLNMIAVRNTTIPGAVNVTFSIVVHQRGWIGSSLLNTEEQTLAKILEGKDRGDELANVYAPGMAAPRDTWQQITQRYDANQDGVVDAQDRATRANETKAAILKNQAEAERFGADLVDLLQGSNEDLAAAEEAGDQEAIDNAKSEIATTEAAISGNIARIQQLLAAESNNQVELDAAVAELEEKEGNQEHAQAQVDQSSGSDPNTCPAGYEQGTVTVNHVFTSVGSKLTRETVVDGGLWTDSQGVQFDDTPKAVDVSDYPEYETAPTAAQKIILKGCVSS
jgi:hypothetical protein